VAQDAARQPAEEPGSAGLPVGGAHGRSDVDGEITVAASDALLNE
jgi:hypothetical protein